MARATGAATGLVERIHRVGDRLHVVFIEERIHAVDAVRGATAMPRIVVWRQLSGITTTAQNQHSLNRSGF
jgi:hypothetical protein